MSERRRVDASGGTRGKKGVGRGEGGGGGGGTLGDADDAGSERGGVRGGGADHDRICLAA